MIKYHIITAEGWADFQQSVQSALNSGWTLQGGVSVVQDASDVSGSSFIYFQAVTKILRDY